MLKKGLKKALNHLGFDLVRATPASKIPPFEWLKAYKIGTFVDVGAHVGEYVDFARSLWPAADVYAFEPLKEVFPTLEAKKATTPTLKAFNVAVGSEKGTVDLHRSSHAPSSSLLPMHSLHKEAFPFSAGETTTQTDVITLDDFFAKVEVKPDVFVKIDTQGFEDRVIRGGERFFKRTKVVLLEVSFEVLYEGQKLFHDLYGQLREVGLEFHGIKNQVLRPSDGFILQAHAYFVRR